MEPIWTLEKSLQHIDRLQAHTQPQWGKMSAQRMVEHLSDVLDIAMGKLKVELLIPEEKVERMQAFLESDKPMARDIQVPFAPPETALRHSELLDAIDEFTEKWVEFEEQFEANPNLKTLHPYYGKLNFSQWKRLNDKHLQHHFEQFQIA